MKLSIAIIILSSPLFVRAQAPVLYDEWSQLNCEDFLSRMNIALVQLKRNPNSHIYFLIYEGRENEYDHKGIVHSRNPAYGMFAAKVRSMKTVLRSYKAPSMDDFRFIRGGFRHDIEVEVWLVPRGSEAPKPTPTVKKIKYRKGKARGFCTSCCL